MRLAVLLLFLTLTGCATAQYAVGVVADSEDKALDSAILVKCRAASIGAIMRRYRDNFRLWTDECIPPQVEVQ